jgi:hypothetical protein
MNVKGGTIVRTALLLVCMLLSACQTVAPWQRGNLAKPQMTLDPLQSAWRTHMYNSREAAFEGGEAEGGGCGCY